MVTDKLRNTILHRCENVVEQAEDIFGAPATDQSAAVIYSRYNYHFNINEATGLNTLCLIPLAVIILHRS